MALLFDGPLLRRLFGVRFTEIGAIPVSVSESESHVLATRVTNKFTEAGSVFADNVILDPARVSFTLRFTDDLLGDTHLDKWEKLLELRRSKAPFDMVTSLGLYRNVFFSGDMSVQKDVTTSGHLLVSCTIAEIPFVTAITSEVPAENSGSTPEAVRKNQPAVDSGSTTGNPAGSSILGSLTSGVL